MRLTKYVHSCVLAEANGETVLFDPGEFSWESGLFDIGELEQLDAVVITHEHPDHFHDEFVQALAEKFPEALFVSTPVVLERLKQIGIRNTTNESTASIEIFSTKRHASNEPLASPAPENIAVHFADVLTFGGDRHDLEECKAILALPIIAPWGSAKEGAEMVMRLRPKYVFPVHDWHWNDTARQGEYARSGGVYAKQGITLVKPIDGEPVEIDI